LIFYSNNWENLKYNQKTIVGSQNRSQNPLFGLKKLLKTNSILEILGQVYQKKLYFTIIFAISATTYKKLSKNNLAVKIDHHLKFAYKI
jgi:hypothetical protein